MKEKKEKKKKWAPSQDRRESKPGRKTDPHLVGRWLKEHGIRALSRQLCKLRGTNTTRFMAALKDSPWPEWTVRLSRGRNQTWKAPTEGDARAAAEFVLSRSPRLGVEVVEVSLAERGSQPGLGRADQHKVFVQSLAQAESRSRASTPYRYGPPDVEGE